LLTQKQLSVQVTQALLDRDYETATVHKTALEDAQRARRKEMEETSKPFIPQYFELDDQKRWRFRKLKCVDQVVFDNGLLMYLCYSTKPYDPREEDGGDAAAAAAAPSQ
jgi:hypothetical protein